MIHLIAGIVFGLLGIINLYIWHDLKQIKEPDNSFTITNYHNFLNKREHIEVLNYANGVSQAAYYNVEGERIFSVINYDRGK